MTCIDASNSNNSPFLNSTLIVMCLTDDLEHLIYWSYFTLPAIHLFDQILPAGFHYQIGGFFK